VRVAAPEQESESLRHSMAQREWVLEQSVQEVGTIDRTGGCRSVPDVVGGCGRGGVLPNWQRGHCRPVRRNRGIWSSFARRAGDDVPDRAIGVGRAVGLYCDRENRSLRRGKPQRVVPRAVLPVRGWRFSQTRISAWGDRAEAASRSEGSCRSKGSRRYFRKGARPCRRRNISTRAWRRT